jgi:hypothetical protein
MTPNKPHWQAIILILVVAFLASCSGSARYGEQPVGPATEVTTEMSPVPSPVASNTGSPASQTDSLADFSFPTEIESTSRYMFYIHGKIIEDQGIPAVSPDYGEYRYEDILRTLQSYGFVLISEQRPKNANSMEYAQRTVAQVHKLLSSGVSPGSITVVGASKGGAITMIISYLLKNSELNYVLLGSCDSPTVNDFVQQGAPLFGNVLAIYDSSDVCAGSCEDLFAFSEGNGLGQHKELVLHVGTGHGILYEPLSEWILPTVRWANQEW